MTLRDSVSLRASAALERSPAEFLFILSAAGQYAGAVIAIGLFDDLAPATVAWLRVLSAAVILLAVGRRAHHANWSAHDLAWVGIFGASTALMNLFFYLGIESLPLGKGVTIEFIGPVAVAAARTRTARNWWALVLAAGGVVVLGGVELGDEPLALVFILVASVMWAGYIVAGSRVALGDRGVAGLGLGLAMGSLVIMPFSLADAGKALTTPSLLGACVLVGLLSSAIGYGIDQSTLRRIPVRRFSVLLALLPVCAMVFGLAFLDQTPTLLDLGGMALVLAGVVIQEREEIERHRPVDTTT
ncbi:MAG: EamA family transporter [Actinomycetota bacterium]